MHLKWEKLVSSLCFHTQLVPRYASVSVNNTSGACEAQPSGNKMQLAAVNLSAQDRADLLAGIGKLAREREADSNFDNFTQWWGCNGLNPVELSS